MSQSAVLRAIYEAIYKNLSELSGKTELFQINDGQPTAPADDLPPVIFLGVSDISQLYPDKNGEKVTVDEALFEAPARVGCILSLTIVSKTYPSILEAAGLIIQYFKDNNTIKLEEHKWHGENDGKVFIEPVIRKPEPQRELQISGFPVIRLEYILEAGINSLIGTAFKRVEKRSVRGNIMENR